MKTLGMISGGQDSTGEHDEKLKELFGSTGSHNRNRHPNLNPFRSAIAIKSKIKIGAWKNPPRNALAGGREPCIFSGLGMAWKTVRSKFY
jgi:hypothetical protein